MPRMLWFGLIVMLCMACDRPAPGQAEKVSEKPAARFVVIAANKIGDVQSAWLLRDTHSNHCLLVIEAAQNYYTHALTSTAWPCEE